MEELVLPAPDPLLSCFQPSFVLLFPDLVFFLSFLSSLELLSLLPFSAPCASLRTAPSPDDSSQQRFTALAAVMSPLPPSPQFPFPLGFAHIAELL